MAGIGPNRFLGLVLIAIGGFIAFFAMNIEEGFGSGALSSRFFPLFLCGILGLTGTLLLVRRHDPWEGQLAVGTKVVGFTALFLIYALTFPIGDFRLWTFVFMGLAMPWLGERRLLRVVIVAAIVAFGVHALFRHGFNTVLPFWF